jgi:hypothetical protein
MVQLRCRQHYKQAGAVQNAMKPQSLAASCHTGPSVSANGSTNGIVWALDNSAFSSSGPAVLHGLRRHERCYRAPEQQPCR